GRRAADARERGRHATGAPDGLEPPHADQAIERVAGQLALDAHARVAAHEDVVTAVGEPLPGDDLAHAAHGVHGRLARVACLVARLELHDAQPAVAGERVHHHRPIARLEHVQRKQRAREESDVGQREDRHDGGAGRRHHARAQEIVGSGRSVATASSRSTTRLATSRKAAAWADSGRRTVMGAPSSPPLRVSGSSGSWPSSGMPYSSATFLPPPSPKIAYRVPVSGATKYDMFSTTPSIGTLSRWNIAIALRTSSSATS